MKFHVLTLFPDMIQNIVETSIVGRAVKNGLISVETTNIRDFSANKHNRVDDYPYGGGAGMVIEAEPVYRAICAAKGEKSMRVIYMTPQAKVLNQTKVEELAMEEELIILCGHYEGIDDRVLQECVTDYISIGDYVLTGGELGAAVLIDAVSRFVPGVLSNDESSQFESLQDNLLEYPHYTRPEAWHEQAVPKVLLSGDHKKIEAWRLEQSLQRTRERRPDLLGHSYKIYSIWYGGQGILAMAEDLTDKLSRYGRLMDYNRRKLQKTRSQFGQRDLLIFFLGQGNCMNDELSPHDEVRKSIEGQILAAEQNKSAELKSLKEDAANTVDVSAADGKVNPAVEQILTMSQRFRNLRGQSTPYVLVYGSDEGKKELQEEIDSFKEKMGKYGFDLLHETIYRMTDPDQERNRIALQIRDRMNG